MFAPCSGDNYIAGGGPCVRMWMLVRASTSVDFFYYLILIAVGYGWGCNILPSGRWFFNNCFIDIILTTPFCFFASCVFLLMCMRDGRRGAS